MTKKKDNPMTKDEKTMMKWFYIFLIWTVICSVSIFYVQWNISVGIWMFITGLTMHLKREDYKSWYNRMYGEE